MQKYEYAKHSAIKPGTFRLLKLLPGSEKSDLEANLVIRWIREERGSTDDRTIVDPEKYQALSYTWGPSNEARNLNLKILAQSESFYIPIRRNLEAALRQLRDTEQPSFWWIDALCINQDDGDEKSSQIPLMSLIYSKAVSVCVWLGSEDATSAQAIAFINKCLVLDDFDELVRDSFASKDWAALSDLMRRPWFNRRWIIQEIALAKQATLYCGKHQVSWRDFADVISLFASKRLELRQLFRESTAHRNHPDYLGDLTELGAIRLVFASDNLFRKTEQGEIMEHLFTLEALMSSMSAFEASNPHDILYAVLWLANDAEPVTKYAPRREGLRVQNWVDGAVTPALRSPIENKASESMAFPDRNIHRKTDSVTNGNHDGNSGVPQPTRTPVPGHQRSTSKAKPDSIVTFKNGDGYEDSAEHPKSARPDFLSVRVDEPPGIGESENEQADTQPGPDAATTGESNGPARRRAHTASHSVASNFLEGPSGRKRRPSILTSNDPNTKATIAVGMFLGGINQRRIVVDYNKTVFEVCRDFLQFTVHRSRSLDMLCRPWAPDDDSLPSWIPPLSRGAFSPGVRRVHRRVNADPLVGEPGNGAKPYRAASGIKASWVTKPHSEKSLVVEGFILDTIKEKKAAGAAGTIPQEWLQAGGWDDQTKLPPDHFWRTLVGNRNAHGQRPPSHWRRVCRDAFTRRPFRGDLTTTEIMIYDCPSAVRDFLERVQCMVWSRRLILFKRLDGSLGLAPINSKKGDLICILYGCSVPVVLRKYVNGKPAAKQRPACDHPDCPYNRKSADGVDVSIHQGDHSAHVQNGEKSDEYYQFIGEVYVHGMMDGEAFVEKRNHDIKPETFELR
ncbi:hypothetical protein LTR85_009852 [Meristemomyces frigidus]|nr:hypothetical protein LTR85_009852 [Meristemomyces frigidus]